MDYKFEAPEDDFKRISDYTATLKCMFCKSPLVVINEISEFAYGSYVYNPRCDGQDHKYSLRVITDTDTGEFLIRTESIDILYPDKRIKVRKHYPFKDRKFKIHIFKDLIGEDGQKFNRFHSELDFDTFDFEDFDLDKFIIKVNNILLLQ